MGNSADHALLSPSGASRWLACPPSARLEQQFPDSSGAAAREGTLAHAISELLLKKALGLITKKEHDYLFGLLLIEDFEDFYCPSMQEYCEQYVTFCMNQFAMSKVSYGSATALVEQRLDLNTYIPEGFGTGDFGIASPSVLKCIDLKYGKGVEVSAIDNKQMKIYALGWLEKFIDVYDIQTVEVTIYQPRIDNYSTWSITVTELNAWAENELIPGSALAFKGTGEYKAGGHCQFCRAKAQCKVLANYCQNLAKYDFVDSPLLDDYEVADVLTKAAIYINWIDAVKEFALTQALTKSKIWPGFKIVAGRSNRTFSDPAKVVHTLETKGFKEEEYVNTKLKNLEDLEQLLGGAKRFDTVLGHLISKAPGKPVLVPQSDKRPVYSPANTANKDFDEEYFYL